MTNIVSINTKKNEQSKEALIEVLDEIRAQVEAGDITELVAASYCSDGEAQIHVSCNNFIGGVGLFEIGKLMFYTQYEDEQE